MNAKQAKVFDANKLVGDSVKRQETLAIMLMPLGVYFKLLTDRQKSHTSLLLVELSDCSLVMERQSEIDTHSPSVIRTTKLKLRKCPV